MSGEGLFELNFASTDWERLLICCAHWFLLLVLFYSFLLVLSVLAIE